MENKETVCAIVVTFNRKDLLIECLDALCKQTRPIDALYIIDNFSNDGTAELLFENGYLKKLPPENLTEPFETEIDFDNSEFLGTFDDEIATAENRFKIYYVRMNENTGGAGGFHEGVKRGYEKGYDWLWLMDDDGVPEKKCLELLIGNTSKSLQYIAPNLIDGDGKSHFEYKFSNSKTDIVNDIGGPFNGILISNTIVKEIGFPMKNYFLWGDEHEYTNRIQEAGFPVATAKKAIHFHKRTSIDYKNAPRLFFLVRNSIYNYRLFKGIYRSRICYLFGVIYLISIAFIKSAINLKFRQVRDVLFGIFRGISDPLRKYQIESCWWGMKDN